MRTLLAISFLALCSIANAAEEGFSPDWYTGLGVGAIALEADLPGFHFDSDDTAWQFVMGLRATPYLSIEGGVVTGGEVRDEVNGSPVTIESTSVQGSLIGVVPLSRAFAVHARAGVIHWDANGRGVRFSDDTGTDLAWGGGASLRIRDMLFRLDYQQADIEDFEARFMTLSVMILI